MHGYMEQISISSCRSYNESIIPHWSVLESVSCSMSAQALSSVMHTTQTCSQRTLFACTHHHILHSIHKQIQVGERLNKYVGYIRAQLAVRVNSKKVPNIIFRHFAERDPITRAAFKNYEPDMQDAELVEVASPGAADAARGSSNARKLPRMRLSKPADDVT